MQKYKLMLVLPFLILIILVWGTQGSEAEEAEKQLLLQQELVSQAQVFAEDEIYFRAAARLEEALEINTSENGNIEVLLLEYYYADGNYDSWISLISSRINNLSASEDEILSLIEYYKDKKAYDEMLSTVKTGLQLYPQSERIADMQTSVIYEYSYKNCDFEDIAPMYDGATAICMDNKWAYTSFNGRIPDSFIYDDATSFCNGYAAVKLEDEVCLINSSMKKFSVCHDNKVDGVFLYDGIRVIVTSGEKYMIADYEMNIIGDAFDFIGASSGNMRAARTGSKWVFTDDNGKKAIDAEFDDIALNNKYSAFCGDIAFVSQDSSYKMINSKGESVNTASFEGAYPFIESGAPAAVKKDGKWGFANASGEIVIPCTYESAKSFSHGLAAVQQNGRWGYINIANEMIIPAEYTSAEPFENKQAIVHDGISYGIITLDYYE